MVHIVLCIVIGTWKYQVYKGSNNIPSNVCSLSGDIELTDNGFKLVSNWYDGKTTWYYTAIK